MNACYFVQREEQLLVSDICFKSLQLNYVIEIHVGTYS